MTQSLAIAAFACQPTHSEHLVTTGLIENMPYLALVKNVQDVINVSCCVELVARFDEPFLSQIAVFSGSQWHVYLASSYAGKTSGRWKRLQCLDLLLLDP